MKIEKYLSRQKTTIAKGYFALKPIPMNSKCSFTIQQLKAKHYFFVSQASDEIYPDHLASINKPIEIVNVNQFQVINETNGCYYEGSNVGVNVGWSFFIGTNFKISEKFDFRILMEVQRDITKVEKANNVEIKERMNTLIGLNYIYKF